MAHKMHLRDYQEDCIRDVLDFWKCHRRGVVAMPTGSGKTITFLGLLDKLISARQLTRSLILVDQIHLVDQPVEKAEQFFPQLLPLISREQSSNYASLDSKVIVACWQSLVSKNRLQRFLDAGGFSNVIVDEAHCNLDKQKEIVGAIGDPFVAGFTATPRRADKRTLKELYDGIASQLLLPDAIARGDIIVPFTAYNAILPLSFKGIRKIGDGWDNDAVAELYKTANVKEIVYKKYLDRGLQDRRTIAYTSTVVEAAEFAAYFRDRGVRAAYIHGGTPKRDRPAIAQGINAGDLQIVFNCDLWTKGFDAPNVSAIMVIRPSRSATTVMQRIGRGLRTSDGKEDCIVILFGPLGDKDIIMAGQLADYDESTRCTIQKAESDGEEIGVRFSGEGNIRPVDPASVVLEAIDFATESYTLDWKVDGILMIATLSTEHSLAIVLPDERRLQDAETQRNNGSWTAAKQATYDFISQCRVYLVGKKEAEFCGGFESFEDAKKAALRAGRGKKEPNLAYKNNWWKRKVPTQPQLRELRRRDIKATPRDRGHAHDLISMDKIGEAVFAADNDQCRSVMEGTRATL